MISSFIAMRERLQHPYLLLILATLFWSGNMVIGRAIRHDVPPFALAFWRWIIALCLMLPFALPHFRQGWPILKSHWKSIIILGMLGVGSYNTFAYLALQHTGAMNASLLNSFTPIATIALSWLILHKPLKAKEWLGVIISLLGVFTIVTQAKISVLSSLSFNLGDLFMLIAVITWALYTVGLHWRPTGVHPMVLLTAFTVVGIIFLTPAYLWEMSEGRVIRPSLHAFLGIGYTGAIAAFLGYVFYNRAVAEVGANRASIFIHLMPVFGTLLSAIFLSETPEYYHFIGIGMIFLGIYLTTIKPKQAV